MLHPDLKQQQEALGDLHVSWLPEAERKHCRTSRLQGWLSTSVYSNSCVWIFHSLVYHTREVLLLDRPNSTLNTTTLALEGLDVVFEQGLGVVFEQGLDVVFEHAYAAEGP